jgi:hypothetical protein
MYVGENLRGSGQSCYGVNLPRVDDGTHATEAQSVTATSDRLDDVVISVLATGPKGCGFEPSQGDGFLRVIKIRSTHPFRMGSKAGKSHVRFYGM